MGTTEVPSEADREPDGGSAAREARLFYLGLAAALLLLGLLGYPLLVGKVYVESDLGAYHLPLRAFYARCLAAGDSFLWFPGFFSGFYLHGEAQVGLYHPLNRLLYAALPLTQAFDLELLRSYVFALPGTFLLLRRWSLARDAAMLGALLFCFSSFNLLHFMHLNVVAAAAHIPWLLLAIDFALRGRRLGSRSLGALAFALVTTSQLLLGHPQIVWNSVLVGILYAAFLAWRERAVVPLLGLGVAGLLGALGAGIQMLPLLESLADSFRADPGGAFLDSIALHPANLAQLVAPTLFEGGVFGSHPHEQSLYVGALAPVLLVWLAIRWRSLASSKGLAGAALVLATLSLLLAMGDWGLLYRVQKMLPVVGLFRAPARYLVLFDLAMAVLVAVAFVDLRRVAEGGARPQWRALLPLLLPAVASLAVTGWGLWLGSNPSNAKLASSLASGATTGLGPLLVIAGTGMVLAAARGARSALYLLLLFAVADQAAYGMARVWHVPATEVETFVATRRSPPAGFRRRAQWEHPSLTVKGVRLASGYAALVPHRELDLGGLLYQRRRFDPDEPRVANARRVAGVGWAASQPVADPLPRVRMLTRAVVSDDPRHDIAAIDVSREALVSEAVELPGGAPGQARIAKERPGEIRVKTLAPTRQLLVLSESHHRGWRAEVDGEPCPVLRVYGDFMGCVVAPGRHAVVFLFEPRSRIVGARLSALGLGLAVLLFGGAWLWDHRAARLGAGLRLPSG